MAKQLIFFIHFVYYMGETNKHEFALSLKAFMIYRLFQMKNGVSKNRNKNSHLRNSSCQFSLFFLVIVA